MKPELEANNPNAPTGVLVQPVVGRCACTQNRTVKQIGYWEHCPLEGGGHTAFYLQRCCDCEKVCGFPDSNLDIALIQGTAATKAKLREIMESSNGPDQGRRASDSKQP